MNIFKKPGRILLTTMIVLAVVCPYRVHMYKTKIEEIQSGKLQIDDMRMQHRIFIHIQHI